MPWLDSLSAFCGEGVGTMPLLVRTYRRKRSGVPPTPAPDIMPMTGIKQHTSAAARSAASHDEKRYRSDPP